MTSIQRRSPTLWKSINYIGRTYIQLQKARIGTESRMRKMIEAELIQEGLMEKVVRVDQFTKKEVDSYRLIKPDVDEEQDPEAYKLELSKIDDSVKAITEEVVERVGYKVLADHAKRQRKEEDLMLKQAKEIFQGSELWTWCERTKGLGEVAALTLLSYINPEIAVTAGKVWKYTGWTPGSKLKAGEQGGFAPGAKGRLYVVANNVFIQTDPYYRKIYDLKKEYYENRPDIIAEKETNKKSWKKHLHLRAFRFMLKILVSHALEIIRQEEGLEFPRPHRWYIPIKPEVTQHPQYLELLREFEQSHAQRLEDLKPLWIEAGEAFEQRKQKIDTAFDKSIKATEQSTDYYTPEVIEKRIDRLKERQKEKLKLARRQSLSKYYDFLLEGEPDELERYDSDYKDREADWEREWDEYLRLTEQEDDNQPETRENQKV